jgi:hypothetical protein
MRKQSWEALVGMNRLCAVFICTVLTGGSAFAADAWFGIDTPDARERWSAQARAALSAPDFPEHSIRLPVADDRFAAIKGAEIYSYLEDVAAVTQAERPPGEKFWGRIAGSAAELATAEYMADKFRTFGLTDVKLAPVQGKDQWWPLDWSVTLLGNESYGEGTTDRTFPSAFPALQLIGEPLSIVDREAELIYVGHGHPVDLVGRDLEGKIAVMLASIQPDPFFQTARGYVDAVIEAGALGVLTVMDAPGNHQYALEDMGPPDAPAFILGGDDGRFLMDAIAAAPAGKPLRARINLQAEVREPWVGANVIGTVRGETDEWVAVIAHLDGYFESANDNGAGLASLLALARFFADEERPIPRRNMLFVGTSGHHEFSDGATALIASHADVLDKAVVVMNVEHPASTSSFFRGPLKFKRFTLPGQVSTTNTHGGRTLNVSSSRQLMIDIYREAIDRYGLVVGSMLERRPPTGDAIEFFQEGYTVVQILDSNIWYHSDGDTIDTIQPVGLARATRVYAEVLSEIETHDREALVRQR